MSPQAEVAPGGTSSPQKKGRIMALDLGEKRIGVAVSDEQQLLARSYAVVQRSSRKADFRRLAEIAAAENVVHLLVGLPIHLDGSEGALAAWVRDYAAGLAAHLQLPYQLWDESFTTREAQASMRARGKRAHQQRDWIDAVAAAMLLQGFLDARERAGR
jgi:putative Holliday junction resolvase